MLPGLVVSTAVGFSTAPNHFDDVVEVGLWPAYQFISKIVKIRVWAGNDKINCIEITYRLSNGNPDTPKEHGTPVGTVHTIDLTVPQGEIEDPEDQFFIGMFGSVAADADAPVLKRLGFLVYDKSTGAIYPFGPFPPSKATNVKGFASLGLLVGFSGTVAANNSLETLSTYKLTPGADAFGVYNI